jgi:hypothetical protein
MLSDLTGVLGLTMRTKKADLTNWAHRHASSLHRIFRKHLHAVSFANLDAPR